MKDKLKEALKVIFDFSYDNLLKEYLTANLLSNESDFIDYILENQIRHLETLKPKIDFFFNGEVNTDCEYKKMIERDEYWFFREYNNYLIVKRNELKNAPPQPISVNESRTKKVIFETFTNIDKQGWQYAFVSEQDYNLFTDLLTNFFEYKPYTLPETIIQLKRTCKTKVAKALGEIHKELSNENKLIADTNYFQLIRVLSHFEKETEGDLYKALTR